MALKASFLGDGMAQPEAEVMGAAPLIAPEKLAAELEPGAEVNLTDGSQYRVARKTASAAGTRFQLSNLAGNKLTLTAAQLSERYLSPKMARIVRAFRFVVAFNKDFDEYVKEAIRSAGYPVDNQVNWADWFQKNYASRMSTQDESLVDEAITHVIVQQLYEGDKKDGKTILQKFNPEKVPADVKARPMEKWITWWLKQQFSFRLSDAKGFINDAFGYRPDTQDKETGDVKPGYGTESIFQENPDGEESVMELEGNGLFNNYTKQMEDDEELGSFRQHFLEWLLETQREKTAQQLIAVFDYIVGSMTGRKSEFRDQFIKEVGKSEATLKALYDKLGDLLVEFTAMHEDQESPVGRHLLVKMIRNFKRNKVRQKQEATKSSALNIAAVEENPVKQYGTPPRTPQISPQSPVPPPPPPVPGQPQDPNNPNDPNAPQNTVQQPVVPGTQPAPRRTIQPELPGVNHTSSEASMSTNREALREKIVARKAAREADKTASSNKFARLIQIATEEPHEMEAALSELSGTLGGMAEALTNFKNNLDLVKEPTPADADPTAHMASVSKYAATLRRIANENPEQLAEALSEVYRSLDEVAEGIENFADHLGVELDTNTEEMPTDVEVVIEPEPKESDTDPSALEPKETEEESKEEKKDDSEEEDTKEASGSDNFVTDLPNTEKGELIKNLTAALSKLPVAELKKLVK